MRAIGLDIGTTTMSAVALDAESGRVVRSLTLANDTYVRGESWERLQDAEKILAKARQMIHELDGQAVQAIGLTGQMHGIVYADANGRSLSPLYTWQDGRGDLMMPDGVSYAERLSKELGASIATGYGAATHFYNLRNDLVPPRAAFAMTIQDYIGMNLAGLTEPLTHTSDAHSFGAPHWPELGQFLRITDETRLIGCTKSGVPVAVAIGDNQASFIGSVNRSDAVLVNVGTGAQISVSIPRYEGHSPLRLTEARPYVDGGTLLVGFSLCGGRAYALLEQLFRQIALMAGAEDMPLYEQMNTLAERSIHNPLNVSTQFGGTRQNPNVKGFIQNIGTDNLTAEHLVQGVLHGMVGELTEPYLEMEPYLPCKPTALIGSGNGIRSNPALRRMFSKAFQLELQIPAHQEEAAYGASLFALAAAGIYPSISAAQKLIHYK